MTRLRQAGIPVFLAAGNHDAESRMTKSLRLPDNVRLFSPDAPETARILDGRIAIHGQSHGAARITANLAAGFPQAISGCINIGLLHTGLNGREGHASYAPCATEDLKSKGYDYWALGHVHRREVVSRDPWILFPGNIQGRHIRETGPKGCLLVSIGADGAVRPDFAPLSVMEWECVTVPAAVCHTLEMGVDAVCEAVSRLIETGAGQPTALRIILSGPCPAHELLTAERDHLTQEIRGALMTLSGRNLWVEKVICDTRPMRPPSLGDDGPLSEVLGLLDELARTDPGTGHGDWFWDPVRILDKKLPPQATADPPAIALSDPAWRAELIGDVRSLLLARLTGGEPPA